MAAIPTLVNAGNTTEDTKSASFILKQLEFQSEVVNNASASSAAASLMNWLPLQMQLLLIKFYICHGDRCTATVVCEALKLLMRFHSLEEFDEGKRSCRKRLDGHNRRRRKSQPESLSRNSSGRFSYNQQAGPTILSFSNPGAFPASSWATGVDYSLQNVNNNYIEGGNGFQILQGGGDDDINPLPSIPPMAAHLSMPGNNNRLSHHHHQMLDSDCALSLLSSAPAETTTTNREMGLMMHTNPMSLMDDPNFGNLSHCSYSQGMEDNSSQVLVNDRRNNNSENSHCPGMMMMFEDGEDEPNNNNTLSFRW